MYAAAHIHFIQPVDQRLFGNLRQWLNEAKVIGYVKQLKDLYMDFVVREPAVFTLDDDQKFFTLFGNSNFNQSTNSVNRNIPGHLAKVFQEQLDIFTKSNPKFPVAPKEGSAGRATMIILDRTIDPVAPLLHEFTYQAMVADLLKVEETAGGLKYTYEFVQEDGTTKEQEASLTDQDAVYTSIRHIHIAITTDQLINDFNKFMDENKGGGSTSGHASARSLHDMKNMIANLPQFQEMKTKFSAHMTIASDCMNEFREQNLGAIGLLEQNMAVGETPEHEVPKNLVEELLPILDDPYTSQMTKARLIMIWFATRDKVDKEDLTLLLSHARLDKEHKDAIENLSLLGVQHGKSAGKQGEKSSRWHKKHKRESTPAQQDVPFDLSRYVPIVKRVAEAHIKETIDQSLFPLIRIARPEDLRRDPTQAPKENYQLRVYKTQWHKKTTGKNAQPKPASGPPVIIFIAGGVTYSEMRSAYELSQAYDRDVYIGSTHIITPNRFVEDLARLNDASRGPKLAVPQYSGSVHLSSKTSPNSPVPTASKNGAKRK
ncbi:Sec1-like protein [Dichotomocladium elegans]|nr:Sec1-like protein [Dichotomocladium elegans]